MKLQLKRAYEEPEKSDGFRILVDRLWPRGVAKTEARVDLWLRDVAPSDYLRKWFAHDPAKWEAFRRRYHDELGKKAHLIDEIRQHAKEGPVTLVYGARDEEHNQAVALKEFIEAHEREAVQRSRK